MTDYGQYQNGPRPCGTSMIPRWGHVFAATALMSVASGTGACSVTVDTPVSIDRLGLVRFGLSSPCRPTAPFIIRYGIYGFAGQTGTDGSARVSLDLFLGPLPLTVEFDDGAQVSVPLPDAQRTFAALAKAAMVWSSGVDLDLHVHEYSAAFGAAAGHWWQDQPGSESQVLQTGAGLLTRTDQGNGAEDHAEVYTIRLGPDTPPGVIRFRTDYRQRGAVSRGPYCGDGALATVGYDAILYRGDRGGSVSRERLSFPRARCEEPLATDARYSPKGFPQAIRIP